MCGQESDGDRGAVEEKERKSTDIPETERTSTISNSLMPMIPSESSICHTNLSTTIMGKAHKNCIIQV